MAGLAKKRSEPEQRIAMDIVIAKRGDVLLKLSKNGVADGTLLVSSLVLSLASPVFEAMFNGSFTEGQDLSAAQPKEVPLPDDDPESMLLMCMLVHMRTDLPKQATFDQLADFAVVCDKYQCTDAVSSWSRVQIAGLLSNVDAPSFEKLVFITYVLDLPHEFGKVTMCIARDRASAFNYHTASHGLDFVPLVVLDHVGAMRDSSLEVARSCLLPKKYYNLVASDCVNAAGALKLYLGGLVTAGIKIERITSVSDLMRRSFHLERLNLNVSCFKHGSCEVDKAQNIHKEVAKAVAEFYQNTKPGCLDCLRKKVNGNENRICRFGHAAAPAPPIAT